LATGAQAAPKGAKFLKNSLLFSQFSENVRFRLYQGSGTALPFRRLTDLRSLDIGVGEFIMAPLLSESTKNMWVFIVSCVVAATIAIGAAVSLQKFQEPAAVAFATSGARI
jgi:hypothetical protein